MSHCFPISIQRLILVLMVLAAAGAARAAEVTSDRARQVADARLSGGLGAAWAPGAAPRTAGHAPVVVAGRVLGHVFAVEPAGFVIVAARTGQTPILAFGPEGDKDTAPALARSPFVRDWLQGLARRGSEADDPAWDDPAGKAAAPLVSAVLPLATAWNQGAPFNDLCPMGDGGRTLVGCVATATAQIMNFHEWPRYGNGTVSFDWDGDDTGTTFVPGGTLTADLGEGYAWSDMPDVVDATHPASPVQAAALADLAYDVAVAIESDFGAGGTTGSTWTARNILVDRFNYAEGASFEEESDFSTTGWWGTIRQEIDEGRPILYGYEGSIPAEGHAFVVHGYDEVGDEHYLNVNYGWENTAFNGSFLLDALPTDPGLGHSMVIGIAPPADTPTLWAIEAAHEDVYLTDQPGETTHVYDGLTFTAALINDDVINFNVTEGGSLLDQIHVPIDGYEIFDDRTHLVKYESYFNVLVTGANVSFGTRVGTAVTLSAERVTGGPGETVSFTLDSTSDTYRFRSAAAVLNDDVVATWPLSVQVSDDDLTATYRFTIPAGTGDGTYGFALEGEMRDVFAKFITPLKIIVADPCPLPAAPVPVAPADGVTVAAGPVLLDWAAAADAAGYEVQVGVSCGEGPITAVGLTQYVLDAPAPGETRFWQVRGVNTCGEPGPWSTCRSFTVDAPAVQTVFHVAPGGDDANPGTPELPFGSIQAAILAAASGDTVVLADGLYDGPGNADIDLAGRDLLVMAGSGDATACEIDAGGAAGFLVFSAETDTCELRDLTITNATVGVRVGAAGGAGAASPTLRGCRIIGCDVGVEVLGLGSAPTIVGGLVSGNGTGLLYDERATGGRVEGTRITGNTGHGVHTTGLETTYGDTPLHLVGCEIDGNGGNGVHQRANLGRTVVTDCLVHDNAGWGLDVVGGVDWGPEVVGGEITGNGLGGVDASGSLLNDLRDCRIAGNTGPGILSGNDALFTMSGCTVEANTGDGILFAAPAIPAGAAIDKSAATATTSITGSDFLRNGGAGIAVEQSQFNGTLEIGLCLLVGNAGPGVAVRSTATEHLPAVALTRCTVVGNGAGLELDTNVPVSVDASIVAFNLGAAVATADSTGLTVTCSDLFGNGGGEDVLGLPDLFTGGDNFSADPAFCDPGADDYGLAAGSPCLDTAQPTCGTLGAREAGDCSAAPAVCTLDVAMLNLPVVSGSLDPVLSSFGVANTGGGYLVVRPDADPDHYAFTPATLVVAPADSGRVAVAYQPSGCRETDLDGNTWDVIATGTACGDLDAVVMGDLFYRLAALPDTLVLTAAAVGDTGRGEAALHNEACGDAGILVEILDDPLGEFQVDPDMFLTTGGETPVAVIYTPRDPGDDECRLRFRVDISTSGGVALDDLEVVVRGQGPPAAPMYRYVAVDGDDAHLGTETEPFATIQHAMDVAAAGDTIVLFDGTFRGDGNRDLTPRGKDLVVRSRSGDPALCIIDCDSTAVPRHDGFVYRDGETVAGGVRGVTIVGAGSGVAIGGGTYETMAAVTVRNCVLTRCEFGIRGRGNGSKKATKAEIAAFGVSVIDSVSALRNGIGLSFVDDFYAAEIRHTTAAFNDGDGLSATGRFTFHEYPVISDCEFTDNGGVGIVVVSMNALVTIESSDIHRNGGDGIVVGYDYAAWVNVFACHISHNGGAGFRDNINAPVNLAGCEIHDNAGPGIHYAWAYTYLGTRDSIIYNNGGPGILIGSTKAAAKPDVSAKSATGILRCEIFGNGAEGIRIVAGAATGPLLVEDCLITGNTDFGIRAGAADYPLETPIYDFIGTTVAGNAGGVELDVDHPANLTRMLIAANTGPGLVWGESLTPTVACTDIHGNGGGDWVGPVADQRWQADNMALDPQFCDAEAGDYGLQDTSPLLESFSPCGRVGHPGDVCEAPVVASRDLQVYDAGTGTPDVTELDRRFTVEAVVAVAPGTYGTGGGGYLQDASGGINFWRADWPETLSVGQRVRLSGSLWYDGNEELYLGAVVQTVLDTVPVVPVDFAVDDLLADLGNIGSYVRVSGTVTGRTDDEFRLLGDAGELTVRRNAFGGVSFAAVADGQEWIVTGPCIKEPGAAFCVVPPDSTCLAPVVPPGPWQDLTVARLAQRGYSSGVAWGDFDGDGDDDLYVVRSSPDEPNVLLVNEGGVFAECTPEALADTGPGTAAAWGDFDNDGAPDLYLANDGAPDRLFRNVGPGPECWEFAETFGGGLGAAGASVACAWTDFDRDGMLEIHVGVNDGPDLLLDAAAGFADAAPAGLTLPPLSQGAAWSDFDLDMQPDVFVVAEGDSHYVGLQTTYGDLAMTTLPADISGQGCAVGDFDNDGDFDVYVTHWGPGNRLLVNRGDGTFDVAPPSVLDDAGRGQAAAWGDFDNDGFLDLFVANHGDANRLFRNEGGTGAFTPVDDLPTAGADSTVGAAWNDIDGDGDLDLYVANAGAPDHLFGNRAAAGGHWLKVRLAGRVSADADSSLANAAAVGAVVMAIAGPDTFTRMVGGDTGYASQGAPTVHFGLGAHTVVDRVVVHWPRRLPNGAHHGSHEFDVAADQVLELTEPAFGPSPVPDDGAPPPLVFALRPCVPNPFNPRTRIAYELPRAATVDLAVYDVTGRLVARLRDREHEPAGRHEAVWQGRDRSGRTVAAGIYFCRIQAGEFTAVRRMTLVK